MAQDIRRNPTRSTCRDGGDPYDHATKGPAPATWVSIPRTPLSPMAVSHDSHTVAKYPALHITTPTHPTALHLNPSWGIRLVHGDLTYGALVCITRPEETLCPSEFLHGGHFSALM